MIASQSDGQTALLLIDIQNGFLTEPLHWGPSRSNPAFEENTVALLASYRQLSALHPDQHKIIHIAHASTSPTSPLRPTNAAGFSFQPIASPEDGELVMSKNVNSAFIGTDLERVLRSHFGGKGTLYIIGLSTDHCVSTTTRMASNLGVCGEGGEVVFVEDATAAWAKGGWDAEVVHKVHAESLKEFASVVGTEEVLGRWKELGNFTNQGRVVCGLRMAELTENRS